MWTDLDSGLEEEDYKKASRLYSPKGVNYQTIYQDQASKNNRGLILVRTDQGLLLFIRKQSVEIAKPLFVNKVDFLKDQNSYFLDSENKSLFLFLGPRLSVPVIRTYLVDQLKTRSDLDLRLMDQSLRTEETRQFLKKDYPSYVYKVLYTINSKLHLDHREQPVTVVGHTAGTKNTCFIIKPSNKITENSLVFEGNITNETIRTFLKSAHTHELLQKTFVSESLDTEESTLDDVSLVYHEPKLVAAFGKEYDIYFLDSKTWQFSRLGGLSQIDKKPLMGSF